MSRKRDPWSDRPCGDCADVGARPDEGRGLISVDSPVFLHLCRRRGIDEAITMADQGHFEHHGTHFRTRLPYAAEVRELRLMGLHVPASGRGLHVEIRKLVTGSHRRSYVQRGHIVWGREAWLRTSALTTEAAGAAR